MQIGWAACARHRLVCFLLYARCRPCFWANAGMNVGLPKPLTAMGLLSALTTTEGLKLLVVEAACRSMGHSCQHFRRDGGFQALLSAPKPWMSAPFASPAWLNRNAYVKKVQHDWLAAAAT